MKQTTERKAAHKIRARDLGRGVDKESGVPGFESDRQDPQTSMEFLKPIARKPRISQEVAQRIEVLIKEGVLKPGQSLPRERDLARRLGVGRASLREALNILEAVGYIEIRSREGSFVKNSRPQSAREPIQVMIDEEPEKLLELSEVRKWIDGQGAAIAAKRATSKDVEALWEVYNQMEKIYEDGDYFQPEYDWLYSRFFKILAQSTHNDLFCQLMRTFGRMLIGSRGYIREQFSRNPRLAKRLLKQHREIVKAVAAHEATRAKRLTIAHIDFIDRRMQELMGRRD